MVSNFLYFPFRWYGDVVYVIIIMNYVSAGHVNVGNFMYLRYVYLYNKQLILINKTYSSKLAADLRLIEMFRLIFKHIL